MRPPRQSRLTRTRYQPSRRAKLEVELIKNPESPAKTVDVSSAYLPKIEIPDGCLFYFFNKLPLELRRKIWGLVPPLAVIIDGIYYFGGLQYDFPELPFSHFRFPAVLGACKESRAEMMYKEGIKKDHPTYTLLKDKREREVVQADSAEEFALLYSRWRNRQSPYYVSYEQDVAYISASQSYSKIPPKLYFEQVS